MKTILAGTALAFAAAALSACTPVTAALGGGVVMARAVVQERSTMDALTDNEIALSINNGLANRSGELFRDVAVGVVEGRVLLTGSVPAREDKIEATRIAWATSGVTAVEDELTVREDSGTRAYLADVGISNRVRYELLTDLDVASANYNVVTVDRVVHLNGLAKSRSELERVISHARSVSGVERVVSHVLTIDDPRRDAPRAAKAIVPPA